MADLQLVVFRLGAEQFAAPIARVKEILRPVKATRMPRSAIFLKGLFNLRGQVLALMDTQARLGLFAEMSAANTESKNPKNRVMVVEARGETIGMMVDEVVEVLRCDEAVLQKPSNVLDLPGGRFLASVADVDGRLVLVLDLDMMVRGLAGAEALAI